MTRQVGASGTGWQRSEAFARASLMVEKAKLVESDQSKWSEGFWVRLRRALRGCRVAATNSLSYTSLVSPIATLL